MNDGSKFNIGDSVMILRRWWIGNSSSEFLPWREGTVTATGEWTVRIRTKTRWPFGRVRWVSLAHPGWRVEKTKEL